ncbi:MAG: glycosyltransferase family 2 protein [Rhodobacteraceae bacterium]|nr:glycosyltransferase family 2 protein [Paracoccaceae bacterium]MBR9819446.1 glycosyltransferase family 2 protein [Paracoccaceae bacterium]
MSETSTYGGFHRIVTQMEGRLAPLHYGPGEALPPEDLDFAPLKTERVVPLAEKPTLTDSTYLQKWGELCEEFAGQPRLLALHGLLIANLRRRKQPLQTAPLFLRMWREEPDFLLQNLDARWKVSALTTFGDHGATEVQRRLGQSLTMLFSMMKLYETERLHSGAEPWQAHPEKQRRPRRLAMEMDPYSIHSGGLDVNLLGRLWEEAHEDALIRPLAQDLLVMLEGDERNVFRRFATMREAAGPDPEREARRYLSARPFRREDTRASTSRLVKETDPAKIRWGLVTTAAAPLPEIARFAAYHLELGAAQLDLYLDTPDPLAEAFLSADPRLHVTLCDAAYWQAEGVERPEDHRQRQVHNAQRSYRASQLHFLGHIDVDEFLMPPCPMEWLLAHLPPRLAALRFAAAELLAGSDRHFKLTAEAAGHGSYALPAVYPTFGEHLKGGFISHTTGKTLARTGLRDVKFNLHRVNKRGAPIQNIAEVLGGYVGHAHVRDFEDFRARMAFRMARGSYRKRPDRFGLHEVLELTHETEGDAGLRRLFDEVCADSPALRARLARHGMLFTRDLDLDARCRRVFGGLPEEMPA